MVQLLLKSMSEDERVIALIGEAIEQVSLLARKDRAVHLYHEVLWDNKQAAQDGPCNSSHSDTS